MTTEERIEALKIERDRAQELLDDAESELRDAKRELEFEQTCALGKHHEQAHGFGLGMLVYTSSTDENGNIQSGIDIVDSTGPLSVVYRRDGKERTVRFPNRCPRCGKEGIYAEEAA